MPNITVRNLPDNVHNIIKTRAHNNNRSTEAEIRAILTTVAASEVGEGFGQFLRSFFEDAPGFELENLRDQTPVQGASFE